MVDSKLEAGSADVKPESLAAKIREVLTQDELNYFLGNRDSVLNVLVQNEKGDRNGEEVKNAGVVVAPIALEGKTEKTELEALIKEHLLLGSYHVFQWFAFDVKRDTVGVNFGDPIKKESFDTTKVYPNIRSRILQSISPEMRDRIEKHVNRVSEDGYHTRTFTRPNGEKVALGQVFVGKTEGREGKGLVLLEGAFSTESNSSRTGGRRNVDNEVLWVFDSLESASKFVSLFDGSKYTNDPTGVEHNEEVIEKSFEATGIDQRYIDTMKARLFWGQEVLIVN